ncbi:MAG: FHA domain-containing protein [Thermoflexales bacterium]|nr:FHA domain-containing protein [Thermoflexales bacterium]MCS7325263.1 FHA domain-containing protein [Thermoflexales bacterium]MCX7939805.1 FHA domain-containing protein [Thermoflexales bacterium]MDW8053568.1 FHA domain-containing protein [Anaerolineae bacterium]MDW8292136.1 FHA domain-containing protein [Anaerolineae bacterium]
MLAFSELWLVALIAGAALLSVAALAWWLWRRRRRGPRIIIGRRVVPLRDTLRLGRDDWADLPEDALKEVEYEHVELRRAEDGHWEVRLYKGEYMFVNGRRSRHNRLQSGAIVTLGQSERARFQFFDR